VGLLQNLLKTIDEVCERFTMGPAQKHHHLAISRPIIHDIEEPHFQTLIIHWVRKKK